VQQYVIFLLVAVLVIAMLSFVVMGVRQRQRRYALRKAAVEMGLAFSSADAEALPLKYDNLAMVGIGHSRRAENIASGSIGHWRVRIFDFRFEVGHGVRRLTRHYCVSLTDLPEHNGDVLMWHSRDIDHAPLRLKASGQTAGQWIYLGDEAAAHRLAHACASLADSETSMELSANVLMVCCPAGNSPNAYVQIMQTLPNVLGALCGHSPIEKKTAASPPAEGENGRDRPVENQPDR